MVIRQRMSRYARAMDAADAAGDDAAVEHQSGLFMKAAAEHRALTAVPSPPPPPTRAGEFTPENGKRLSDTALMQAWNETADDPQAREAIERIFEERDAAQAQARADEAWREVMNKPIEECTDEELEARFGVTRIHGDRSPLTNPARRPARKLTAEQQAREEYDQYVQSMYLEALEHCKTTLVNKRGRTRGISDMALFTGSAKIARAYGSEELQAFFQKHGRLSYAAFRYERLNRPGDRRAWLNSTLEKWGHVAAA